MLIRGTTATIERAEIAKTQTLPPPRSSEPIQPPPITQKQSQRLPYIQPSELQVNGETTILFATLGVFAVVLIFVSLTTALLFVVFLAIYYITLQEEQKNLQRTASKITAQSQPALDALVHMTAKRLTVPTPELFVVQSPEVNAYAKGVDKRGTVVLYSKLIEIMTQDEIVFIIGHEISHIKCGHCKYLLFTNAATISSSSINRAVSSIANLIFKVWNRKSEFTCDRGGVVACRNPNAAMTALAKLECRNPFSPEDVAAVVNSALGAPSASNALLSTHPETSNRINAVWAFSQSKEYARLSSLSN